MAATITITKILDSRSQTILRVNIEGDAAGDLTTTLYTPGSYLNTGLAHRLMNVKYCFDGFSGVFKWGNSGTATPLITGEKDHYSEADFKDVGGLSDVGISGRNGAITLTTIGLAATKTGYVILTINHADE